MDHDATDRPNLHAGEFSSWLGSIRAAIRGAGVSAVPCDGCTACCTSSQFVHIGPDEVDTRTHIDPALLFPAPGMPEGHVLLGYDERGHCPLLVDGGCSIYDHRPRACRTYDCRVFAASGVEVDEPEKAGVAERARRWRFSYREPDGPVHHDAIRAAAAYLDRCEDTLPSGLRPLTATRRAVLAVELVDLFVGRDPSTGAPVVVQPDPGSISAELERRGGIGPGRASSRKREPDGMPRRTDG